MDPVGNDPDSRLVWEGPKAVKACWARKLIQKSGMMAIVWRAIGIGGSDGATRHYKYMHLPNGWPKDQKNMKFAF